MPQSPTPPAKSLQLDGLSKLLVLIWYLFSEFLRFIFCYTYVLSVSNRFESYDKQTNHSQTLQKKETTYKPKKNKRTKKTKTKRNENRHTKHHTTLWVSGYLDYVSFQTLRLRPCHIISTNTLCNQVGPWIDESIRSLDNGVFNGPDVSSWHMSTKLSNLEFYKPIKTIMDLLTDISKCTISMHGGQNVLQSLQSNLTSFNQAVTAIQAWTLCVGTFIVWFVWLIYLSLQYLFLFCLS